jgi:hypothetical protein
VERGVEQGLHPSASSGHPPNDVLGQAGLHGFATAEDDRTSIAFCEMARETVPTGDAPTRVTILGWSFYNPRVMTGKDPRYVKHPTTWLNKGCWTDEHAEPGGFGSRASDSTNAVWSAIDAMPARNRRAG